jgi:hypothetical protein
MKHKYIKTPEELYILFEGYKNSLVEREIQKATAGGVKTEKHKPPLTISGFRVYGHKNGFSIEHYFANTGRFKRLRYLRRIGTHFRTMGCVFL